jgi:hypothetical protein
MVLIPGAIIAGCAIYISPIAKDKANPHQLKFYYQINEELLKYNITSQVIEKEAIESPGFKYSLPNIYTVLARKLTSFGHFEFLKTEFTIVNEYLKNAK